MSEKRCWEYMPRWSDIMPLIAAGNFDAAQAALDDRDQQWEQFVQQRICNFNPGPGGLPYGDAVSFLGDGSIIDVEPGTPFDLEVYGPVGEEGTFLVWGSFFIYNSETPGAEIIGDIQIGAGASFLYDQAFDVNTTEDMINVSTNGKVTIAADEAITIRFINSGTEFYHVQGTVSWLQVTFVSGG